MNKKSSLFDQMYDEVHGFQNVMIQLITKRLEKHGIELSQKQIDNLKKKLKKKNIDKLEIKFDHRQLELIQDDNIINDLVDFSTCEDELEEIHNEIDQRLEEKLPDLASLMAKDLVVYLKQDSQRMLKLKRKEITDFNKSLTKEWRNPIDIFETFILLCDEMGINFVQNYINNHQQDDPVLYVLSGLHSRAIHISNEILTLIKNGFADAAFVRWRSLHEVAVISKLIGKNDDELAKRYVYHENIESYKIALLNKKYAHMLGPEIITEGEFSDIEETYHELLKKYGKSYKNPYGWASDILNKNNPTFADIEEYVELDHHRPYYKMASHNVHANPKGVMFKLGDINFDGILTGPSNFGFTDPADSCSISLLIIMINLLTHKLSFDDFVSIEVLKSFQAEIGNEFLKVQMRIECDHKNVLNIQCADKSKL